MKPLYFLQLFCVVLLFSFLASVQQVSAQATLSVQGTVQKSTGAAVDDGDYSLTFRLYTTETGGNPVWSETQGQVNIVGGVYSVTLGTVTPLTAAFDQTYYLGITVGSGAELTPRARLTSSPYALSLIGQDNKFPSTGPVGVGTASPTTGNELHVKDAAAGAQVLVEGATTSKILMQSTDGTEIQFKKGANTASITYDGNNINIQNLNLVFSNGISLPAGQAVSYNGLKDWRLIDTDDFETGVEGWICHDAFNTSNPANFKRLRLNTDPANPLYNGYAIRVDDNGNDALKKQLNLTGIPHTYVKVVFTYHFLDSWDGKTEYEQGFAGFALTDAPSANNFVNCWVHLEAEGAGNDYFTQAVPGFTEYSQYVEMVIQNSSDNLWVIVSSTLGHSAVDESFAIDNVEIWVK